MMSVLQSGRRARDKDELWLLKKTLYGLRRSPRHWCNKFTSILEDMGLAPSVHDPCVYRGVCTDTDNPAADDTEQRSTLAST